MAAVDVQHLVEHPRQVEAQSRELRRAARRLGTLDLVELPREEPAAIAEGELQLIAVALALLRPEDGIVGADLDLAYTL